MASYNNILFQILGLICVTLLVEKSYATEFTIGGSKGWTVPYDNSEPHYNEWAQKIRFQIGDTLVFNYPTGQDSVLLVSETDYVSCVVDNPKKKFDDGHTIFKFEESGPHYFISGNRENCLKNEKVAVVVLADRSSKQPGVASPPPPPPPPPSSESPAPSGEVSPTPTTEATPPPPPSAATNVVMSFLGCIGASVASFLALGF